MEIKICKKCGAVMILSYIDNCYKCPRCGNKEITWYNKKNQCCL